MAEQAYVEALKWLYGLSPRGVRLGLERVAEALRLRGNPQVAAPVIHVAGTNGKGSVCAMIERALRADGRRTGLYTSPHLHRFVERIRIDGDSISEGEVARRVNELRHQEGMPILTFFEYATLIAFEAFRDADVDVGIFETGLGGRLDATNLVTPKVTVITPIDLDHQAHLGDSLEEIAAEKAGIITEGVPVILGASPPEAEAVVQRVADEKHAKVLRAGKDFGLVPEGGELYCFEGLGERLPDLRLGLGGPHAPGHAALAVAAIIAFGELSPKRVSDAAIYAGLREARWPGRYEWIEGSPPLLLDASHNPAGCRALAAYLEENPIDGPTVVLFGAMKDKDLEGMLGAFDPVADARVYASPQMERAAEPEAFDAIRPGEVRRSVGEGIAAASDRAGPDGRVVICGSIFLVAEARAILLDLPSDPPIGL